MSRLRIFLCIIAIIGLGAMWASLPSIFWPAPRQADTTSAESAYVFMPPREETIDEVAEYDSVRARNMRADESASGFQPRMAVILENDVVQARNPDWPKRGEELSPDGWYRGDICRTTFASYAYIVGRLEQDILVRITNVSPPQKTRRTVATTRSKKAPSKRVVRNSFARKATVRTVPKTPHRLCKKGVVFLVNSRTHFLESFRDDVPLVLTKHVAARQDSVGYAPYVYARYGYSESYIRWFYATPAYQQPNKTAVAIFFRVQFHKHSSKYGLQE